MRIYVLLLLCLSMFRLTAQEKVVYYFPFASSELSEGTMRQVEMLISQLRKNDAIIIDVNGHTDKTGTDDFNQMLSHDRAAAVVALLQRSLPDAKISVNSYGAAKLISDKEEEQHLNRRVEIFIQRVKKPETQLIVKEEIVLQVEPFREDVEMQRFTIDLTDTVRVRAKEGTYIKIDPGSIQTIQGELATGIAELIIKEYYDPAKIMLAGLNSMSDKGLLQTGGMTSFTIMQGGQEMNTVTRKPVLIRMPQHRGELINMDVYTIPPQGKGDTLDAGLAIWNNTNLPFTSLKSYWDRPYSRLLTDVFDGSTNFLTDMKVGKTFEDEHHYRWVSPFRSFYRSYAKKYKTFFLKKNDSTIEVRAKIRYRDRGYRAFQRRSFDTTYHLKFIRSEYEGITNTLNFINCDRLFPGGIRIDQYVSTPGVSGVNILAYFKGINAYLPASYANAGPVLFKIPDEMPMTVIAIGKKGNDFYFGKMEYKSNAKVPCVVKVEKIEEEEFRREMKSL